MHRKASYESDGIKPSEVAKDHFLTPEEREHYARQLAEEQHILQLQQKHFVQRKCQVSTVEEIDDGSTITQTKVVERTREEIVETKGDDKHPKLVRSAAIERSEETQVQSQNQSKEIVETKAVTETKREETQASAPPQTKRTDGGDSTKSKVTFDEKSCNQAISKSSVEEITQKHKKPVDSGNSEQIISKVDEPIALCTTASALTPPASTATAANNDLHTKLEISTAQIIDASQLPLTNLTNKNSQVHTVEQQLALCATNTANPQDAGGNSGGGGQQSANNQLSRTGGGSAANGNSSSGNPFRTISTFTFHDHHDRGPPGLPPAPNLPDFLIPRHLITYETSFEFHIRRIPNPLPPPPPPPPVYLKKLLVHTESLEQKTRAFLSGTFETGPTDAQLLSARRKIRSLKSTILKSDDEVKHAKDTIYKAQSGDFLNIIQPPIIEPPSYEFIEIPSERSEEECSEFSDRRSERGISEQISTQGQGNMEDYYTSKYSRSSRRQVEGKLNSN